MCVRLCACVCFGMWSVCSREGRRRYDGGRSKCFGAFASKNRRKKENKNR